MRFVLAIICCKLIRLALRLLGRGGTALPGKVALRICPDMLSRLARGVTVAVVTGTNGKTTTCRMLEKMLRDAGLDCFANRSGSNLERGITADFVSNAGLFGRPKKKLAVIECDEAAFRRVCGELAPKVCVVTNVFRDQLDRYGEVTHTLGAIREGLEHAAHATVCLNADCSLTASLAPCAPDRVRFFGVDAPLAGSASDVSDAPRCIVCGAQYEYDYHTFAHLGGFRCPKCGYGRTEPDVAVLSVEELTAEGSAAEMRVDGEVYAAVDLPGGYNLYNAAAAVAAATALGVAAEGAVGSLARLESGFGRMERFALGNARVTMVLVKNPAGCDRAIDFLRTLTGGLTAVFCLNDNLADGTDVSWIWDAGFERLFAPGAPAMDIIVSGTRSEDMLLRLKYAGADAEHARLIRSTEELVAALAEAEGEVCVLPTYTAMLPLRAALAERCGGKEFWK